MSAFASYATLLVLGSPSSYGPSATIPAEVMKTDPELSHLPDLPEVRR